MKQPPFPRVMREAPLLPSVSLPSPVHPKRVLLLNPFYARNPSGSYMKHALTPSLALTTIAAATPPDWEVEYWDENLLKGPPPAQPVPRVVGISVHLTFARRAYELAAWYRRLGSTVILSRSWVSR